MSLIPPSVIVAVTVIATILSTALKPAAIVPFFIPPVVLPRTPAYHIRSTALPPAVVVPVPLVFHLGAVCQGIAVIHTTYHSLHYQ